MGGGDMLNKKQSCPKCGSGNISEVTTNPLKKGGGLRTNGDLRPKDEPRPKVIRPMTDFNHPYYCNSCGHYFGGGFGGIL